MRDNDDPAELIQIRNPQNNTFTQEQKADSTLQRCFEKVTEELLTPERPDRYRIHTEILVIPRRGGENLQKQLVVSSKYQQKIMERGHSDIFSAHLGITRTKQRISQNFHWPEMGKQIKEFCQKCDVCQRQGNSNNKTKAQLCPLPIISTPFQHIRLDIVGPLPRVTQRGNRFILTIIDYATRYPEAVPLRNIETHTVADALLSYMSHMGFAFEIVTDLGSSFTSKLMQKL